MTPGVLLMAYGSPETRDDVLPYYTHIRGGRPPSPDLLRDLIGRYEAIGALNGRSPLNEITRRQAAGLEAALRARGVAARVWIGMKHHHPFIGDAVRAMAADGIERAVGLVLAPHYSTMSVGAYIHAAEEARPPEMGIRYVESWHDHPGFIATMAGHLRSALGRLEGSPSVVFTAHSLPERIETWHDRYPGEVRRTCELVAERAEVERWTFAYQSAGRTSEPWLGPDLLSTLERLHSDGGRDVVVCPVGFVSDHLEVLYDLDIEAQAVARRLGMRLDRPAMMNDDPAFLAALAGIAESRLA